MYINTRVRSSTLIHMLLYRKTNSGAFIVCVSIENNLIRASDRSDIMKRWVIYSTISRGGRGHIFVVGFVVRRGDSRLVVVLRTRMSFVGSKMTAIHRIKKNWNRWLVLFHLILLFSHKQYTVRAVATH